MSRPASVTQVTYSHDESRRHDVRECRACDSDVNRVGCSPLERAGHARVLLLVVGIDGPWPALWPRGMSAAGAWLENDDGKCDRNREKVVERDSHTHNISKRVKSLKACLISHLIPASTSLFPRVLSSTSTTLSPFILRPFPRQNYGRCRRRFRFSSQQGACLRSMQRRA